MPDLLPWSRLFSYSCTNALKYQLDPWFDMAPEEIFRAMHWQVLIADMNGRGEPPEEFHDLDAYADYVDGRLAQVTLYRELPNYATEARMARRSFLHDTDDQEGVDYQEDNFNSLITPDFSVLTDPSDEVPDLVTVLAVESDGEIERRSQ